MQRRRTRRLIEPAGVGTGRSRTSKGSAPRASARSSEETGTRRHRRTCGDENRVHAERTPRPPVSQKARNAEAFRHRVSWRLFTERHKAVLKQHETWPFPAGNTARPHPHFPQRRLQPGSRRRKSEIRVLRAAIANRIRLTVANVEFEMGVPQPSTGCAHTRMSLSVDGCTRPPGGAVEVPEAPKDSSGLEGLRVPASRLGSRPQEQHVAIYAQNARMTQRG